MKYKKKICILLMIVVCFTMLLLIKNEKCLAETVNITEEEPIEYVKKGDVISIKLSSRPYIYELYDANGRLVSGKTYPTGNQYFEDADAFVIETSNLNNGEYIFKYELRETKSERVFSDGQFRFCWSNTSRIIKKSQFKIIISNGLSDESLNVVNISSANESETIYINEGTLVSLSGSPILLNAEIGNSVGMIAAQSSMTGEANTMWKIPTHTLAPGNYSIYYQLGGIKIVRTLKDDGWVNVKQWDGTIYGSGFIDIVIVCNEHKITMVGKKEASYKERGYTGDSICSICGLLTKKGSTTPYKSLRKPTISSSVNSSTGTTVKWGKVTGATGYVLQRSADGKTWKTLTTIKSGSTVSYLDKSAKTNGARYIYRVYAYAGSTSINKSAVSASKTSYYYSTPTISSLKNSSSKAMTVGVAKNTKSAYYQIQYSTSSSFKSAKAVTVKSTKAVSQKISKLTKGKTYYVRVRAYKKVGNVAYYSGWSTVKKVKITK